MTSRLGRGLAFPPIPVGGSLAWVEGADAVAHALRDLLLTEPGERIGRPTYGVGLRQFLFEPNTVSTRTRIRDQVVDGLGRHEARARLGGVDVVQDDAEPTLLRIVVRYRLVDDPTDRSLIFPFYLEERR